MGSSYARLVPAAFMIIIGIGTGLLMLPLARTDGIGAPFLTALFTATSATTVTGLTVVDTAIYWTGFGQAVIFALCQIGGFGIMSGTTLLMLMVSRKHSVSAQLMVQVEARGIALGDVKLVLFFALRIMLVVQLLVGLFLSLRFLSYDMPAMDAFWHGYFHAGSALTNGGFTSLAGGLTPYMQDPSVILTCAIAVVLGGLGLPVLHDITRHRSRHVAYSLHTKLTLTAAALLLPLGFAATLLWEWDNAATLGPLPWLHKVTNALFHSVMTRSGGLNTFDTAAITQDTMLVTYGLMFIGGGSASMAGGIKATTFLVIVLAVWFEVRGTADVAMFKRRISSGVLREALTIFALAFATVATSTLLMRSLTDLPLRHLVFDIISAFANCGLSMGITGSLPASGQCLLIGLMFMGRVGIITVAVGLAMRSSRIQYRYPEERPVIG